MRILVIEDEKSIAAEIAATLTNARYVVDVAHDGENGWFRAETEDYQAIVLDLGLPRLDGLSVVKKLRASGIATPILILTARGSWMDRVEGIDAGADDYFPNRSTMRSFLRGSTRSYVAQPATLGLFSSPDH